MAKSDLFQRVARLRQRIGAIRNHPQLSGISQLRNISEQRGASGELDKSATDCAVIHQCPIGQCQQDGAWANLSGKTANIRPEMSFRSSGFMLAATMLFPDGSWC
jgi:hypothetical protein